MEKIQTGGSVTDLKQITLHLLWSVLGDCVKKKKSFQLGLVSFLLVTALTHRM